MSGGGSAGMGGPGLFGPMQQQQNAYGAAQQKLGPMMGGGMMGGGKQPWGSSQGLYGNNQPALSTQGPESLVNHYRRQPGPAQGGQMGGGYLYAGGSPTFDESGGLPLDPRFRETNMTPQPSTPWGGQMMGSPMGSLPDALAAAQGQVAGQRQAMQPQPGLLPNGRDNDPRSAFTPAGQALIQQQQQQQAYDSFRQRNQQYANQINQRAQTRFVSPYAQRRYNTFANMSPADYAERQRIIAGYDRS